MKAKRLTRLLLPLSLTLVLLLAGALGAMAYQHKGDYDLTFRGNQSFQGAHGGQTIHVALVHPGTNEVVDRKSGTVSANNLPAFSFTFENALEEGKRYHVHYWIDSNFGGGEPGVCDPKKTDHQWHEAVGEPDDDMRVTVTHNPGKTTPVCHTFPSS